jgi:hypothetical protein
MDDVHTLAGALQQEMPGAWQEVKQVPFPGDPNDPNQKILFLAIARGLLKYLNGRSDLISQMNIASASGYTVNISGIKFNISGV